MRLSFLASLGSFLILLLTSHRAWSAECDREKSHVMVEFSDNWAEASKSAVLSDLAAALAPKSMGACAGSGSGDSVVAKIRVELNEVTVSIEVDDSLTDKKVSRDVTLSDASDSSSALLVAVAIDELLRATWAELSLAPKEAPAERPEPEPAPEAEVPPQPKSEPSYFPRHRVALRASVDSFVLASTLWGGDITYGSSLGDAFEWTAFAGPRVVRSDRATELGQVRADAVSFGGELSLPVVVTRRFFLGPQVSIAATHAWLSGEPEANAEQNVQGASLSGWALVARAGLFGRLHFGSTYVAAASRVGAPLLGLEVTDGNEVVGGLSGLEWSNSLALGWWWSR